VEYRKESLSFLFKNVKEKSRRRKKKDLEGVSLCLRAYTGLFFRRLRWAITILQTLSLRFSSLEVSRLEQQMTGL